MTERIVVCFRAKLGAGHGSEGDAYLERAREVAERAEALGGSLCAWSSKTFAFELAIEDIEEAVELAASVRDGGASSSGLPAWGCAIAQGEMRRVAKVGPSGVVGGAMWGAPLVEAVSLARIARPGEVLLAPRMPAVRKRELLTCGSRVASDDGLRVRGLVLDPRQAWRRDAAQSVTKLLRPAFVDRDEEIARLVAEKGVCGVVRAQPGYGGTRLLEEVALALEPARSLLLQPAGAEPLGALRRAIARFSEVRRTPRLPEELAQVLLRVRDGRGAELDAAGRLLAHWVAPSLDAPPGALLVDDAMDLDTASLDAVAAACTMSGVPPFYVVVRLDAEAPFPAQLAAVPPRAEIELGALDRASAARLASACTNDRMTPEAARRWAKRGRYVPVGITEAIAEALTTGELSWSGEAAEPRTRVAGKGKGLEPGDWIARRLAFVPREGRALLDAIAVLGGDAPIATIEPLVKAATDRAADVVAEADALVATAWLTRPEPGWIAMPTKTHREVCLRELGDARRLWHRAASLVLEHLGDRLAAAEAAAHAELAGDHTRATRLGVVAERMAREAGLDWALGPALVRRTVPPPSPERPPVSLRPSAPPAASSGAERRQAIEALSKGDKTEALSALRKGVERTRSGSPEERCRALLAYGVALAAAGRHREALIEALDALARAREAADRRGESVCARFLAKLAEGAGQPEVASRWRQLADSPG